MLLLRQYNLDMAEIEAETDDVIEETIEEGRAERKWRTLLIAAICTVNYTAMYRQLWSVSNSSKARRVHSYSMRVVGKSHNVASTKTMIEYLLSAVERLSVTVDGRHRDAYRLGVSTTLRERLLEMWKAEQAASNECRELVLREDSEARKFLKDKGVVARPVRPQFISMDHYTQGQADGHRISLRRQVKSS